MTIGHSVDPLFQIAEATFGIPARALSDESSPVSVAAWDSLGHLNLILALEAAFNVSFSPEDVINMRTLGAIRDAMRAQGVDL